MRMGAVSIIVFLSQKEKMLTKSEDFFAILFYIRTLILEDYPEQNMKFLRENNITLFQFGIAGNKVRIYSSLVTPKGCIQDDISGYKEQSVLFTRPLGLDRSGALTK